MNGYLDIAAMLGALAEWVDESLAGGDPPKWVARGAAEAARAIAGDAGLYGRGEDPLGGGAEVSDDITMMLRRPPEPPPSQRGGWRQRIGRVRARVRLWSRS